MTYRILMNLFIMVLLFSCEKNTPLESDNYFQWTGTIIDQETGQPVQGATVALGYRRFCERPNFEPFGIGLTATSGPDGKFIIKVLKSYYSGLNQPVGCCGYYAEKKGYAGSTSIDFQWSKNDPVVGEVGVINLVPFATLNLHVKRDSIADKYESVEIWLSRYKSFTYWYDYKIYCIGKTFDSIFYFDSLWSNTKYSIETGPIARRLLDYQTYYRREIYLLPNTKNELFISFTHGKE